MLSYNQFILDFGHFLSSYLRNGPGFKGLKWTTWYFRNKSNNRNTNLRLCSCVICLKRKKAPLTDIFLGVRMRSTSEPQSLRTLPTDLQVLLYNSPVNSRLNPSSDSREASCSPSSFDRPEMNVHTLWKNSASQLKHNNMDEERTQQR